MFGLRFLFDPRPKGPMVPPVEKNADTKLFCLSDFVRQHAEAKVHRVVRVIFLNIAEGQGQHMEQAMFFVGSSPILIAILILILVLTMA